MLFLFIKYYKNMFIFDIIFMVNNMISKRLQEIAKYVYPYKKIADVGCDHGYLIIEAIKKYNVTNCIAIDNKEGPLNVAKYNITNVGYLDKVRFSLSSGITDIDNDTEAVVISGMGGVLITQILSEKEKLTNIKRLILQPNRNSYELRKFLMENGFYIVSEEIIFEDGKFYEIIVSERGNMSYNDDELMFGPVLLKEKSEEFINKINSEIIHLKNLDTNSSSVSERIKKLEEIIC